MSELLQSSANFAHADNMNKNHYFAIAILFFCFSVSRAQDTKQSCTDPESRRFDFWVGEWDVKHSDGREAGSSNIQLILDDCSLLENWTGKSGYSGKSLNVYHKGLKKWQQFWVDNQGGSLYFEGEFRNGNLIYEAVSVDSNGVRANERMTFTPIAADHVRQLWKQSKDGGKTWSVLFDGHYHRKEKK